MEPPDAVINTQRVTRVGPSKPCGRCSCCSAWRQNAADAANGKCAALHWKENSPIPIPLICTGYTQQSRTTTTNPDNNHRAFYLLWCVCAVLEFYIFIGDVMKTEYKAVFLSPFCSTNYVHTAKVLVMCFAPFNKQNNAFICCSHSKPSVSWPNFTFTDQNRFGLI